MSNSKIQTSQNLSAGEFYSPVLKQLSAEDFTLSELRHSKPSRFPKHTHEAAYFSLLLEGSYAEYLSKKILDYKPLMIAWHPPEMVHYDEVGKIGAHFFTIEIKPALLRKLADYSAAPDEIFLSRSELSWLGMRLFREFKTGDSASPLAIEGLLLEMLVSASRTKPVNEKQRPVWLGRVLERLEAEFTGNVSIEKLAGEAGVHPAHLSATFRRFQNETIGEYVQKLRVAYASKLLLNREIPLAEIAFSAGFSDQSHFTRIFKRFTGVTPGAFRQ